MIASTQIREGEGSRVNFRTGFEPHNTRQMVFHSPDGAIAAEFMFREGMMEHGRLAGAQLLSIAMGSDSDPATMFVVLPDQGEDIDAIFAALEPEQLPGCPLAEDEVALYFPKFTYTPPVPDGLRIADVTHRAHIEVNEDGCEAAAVTCFLGIERARRVVDIRVDRPFAFVLDHKAAGMLGAGVIKNPVPTR